jgi:predicted small lipoprotein YifL
MEPVYSGKRIILSILLLLFCLSSSCGKKGPPVAPESLVPAPVSDLRAWVRERTVTLQWTLPKKTVEGLRLEDLAGFRVFRRALPIASRNCPTCPLDFKAVAVIELNYPKEGRIEGDRVLWEDFSLQAATEYSYFVVGYNADRAPGPESNRITLFWDIPPAAPTDLRIKSENMALALSWKFSRRLEDGREMVEPFSFNLYRQEGEPFQVFPLNPEPIRETQFLEGGLENGKKYAYQVRAVRDFHGTRIEGPPSITATGTPQKTTPPSPPTGIVATIQKQGVELRWEENPEPDILGYNVYRRQEGETEFIKLNPQPVTAPFFLDESAKSGKTYIYRLKAVDSSPSHNESEFSKEIEVFPEPNPSKGP